MSSFLQQSHDLARKYLDVKYSKGNRAELLAECNAWLKEWDNENQGVREFFKGSRMLYSQLDLLDKAKHRVLAIQLLNPTK